MTPTSLSGITSATRLSSKRRTGRFRRRQKDEEEAQKALTRSKQFATDQSESKARRFDEQEDRKERGIAQPVGHVDVEPISRPSDTVQRNKRRLQFAKDEIEVAGDEPLEKTRVESVFERKTGNVEALRRDLATVDANLKRTKGFDRMSHDDKSKQLLPQHYEAERERIVSNLVEAEKGLGQYQKGVKKYSKGRKRPARRAYSRSRRQTARDRTSQRRDSRDQGHEASTVR